MMSDPTQKNPIIIKPVKDSEAARLALPNLSDEWVADGSFWNLQSCIDTMQNHQYLSSSAAMGGTSSDTWTGWYLATYEGSDCELLFIFTCSASRGQGIGAALLEDLIKRARAVGDIESIFLEVRISNQPAIKLYERFGFMRQSIRPRYYSNGEDALVYRCNL